MARVRLAGAGRRASAVMARAATQPDRTAFRLLAAMLVLFSLTPLLIGLGFGPEPADRPGGLVVGVGMLIVAVIALLVGRRPGRLGLHLVLALAEVHAVLMALRVQDDENAMALALWLVMLGVFIGSFVLRPWIYVHIGALVVVWLLGSTLAVDIRLSRIIVVSIGIALITLVVAALAEGLRELALRDPLTGALNRRGLDLLAPRIAASAARLGVDVTVGITDMDEFKLVNDRLGHVEGDQQLRAVADAWTAELRADDLFVRFGGDEFAVVLPGSTPETARELVARVRRRDAGAWSIGLAAWEPGEDVYEALKRADLMLYADKGDRRSSPSSSMPPASEDLPG